MHVGMKAASQNYASAAKSVLAMWLSLHSPYSYVQAADFAKSVAQSIQSSLILRAPNSTVARRNLSCRNVLAHVPSFIFLRAQRVLTPQAAG